MWCCRRALISVLRTPGLVLQSESVGLINHVQELKAITRARPLHLSSPSQERGRPQAVPLRPRKAAKSWDDLANRKRSNQFIDWMQVKVAAGDGGDGSLNLGSEYMLEFAGPDGGNGGSGGHVIFKASRKVSSLNHLTRVIVARPGGKGGKQNMDGKNAEHSIVEVPIGTIFRNMEGEIVCELLEEEALFVAAKGGGGGKGNAFFKTAVRQSPRVCEMGGTGEIFVFEIETRTMAHVGLIGFPNAGKSTFLRAISRARPKVAAYPFTTLNPYVGMVRYDDYEQLSVADIPGIIKDAHKDKGLGISFLRHIERCLCLLYVIDLSDHDPIDQLKTLKLELEHYEPGLSRRPHAILANKIDDKRAQDNLETFLQYTQRHEKVSVFCISGKMGMNLRDVLDFIRILYDAHVNTETKNQDTSRINGD